MIDNDAVFWSGQDSSEKDRRLVGQSPELKRALNLVQKVAKSDVAVLIIGESGTGKELIARAVHTLSDRNDGPFVAVHCASIPETLLESELFGYERGSFTGAYQRRVGKFEHANKGTLFLDEIGEAPAIIQVKLLRALQEREVERIGSNETIPIDVRIVSATNKDLREEIEKESSEFRLDLYYRLSTVPIYLPPLRNRKGDIPLLIKHFIEQACAKQGVDKVAVSDETMKQLSNYSWPGNVRELENVINRAVVLQEGGVILPSHLWLSEPRIAAAETDATGAASLKSAAKDAERKLIVQSLEANQWNKTKAAKALGISYRSLMYKMNEYNLRSLQKSRSPLPFSKGEGVQ